MLIEPISSDSHVYLAASIAVLYAASWLRSVGSMFLESSHFFLSSSSFIIFFSCVVYIFFFLTPSRCGGDVAAEASISRAQERHAIG